MGKHWRDSWMGYLWLWWLSMGRLFFKKLGESILRHASWAGHLRSARLEMRFTVFPRRWFGHIWSINVFLLNRPTKIWSNIWSFFARNLEVYRPFNGDATIGLIHVHPKNICKPWWMIHKVVICLLGAGGKVLSRLKALLQNIPG